MCKLEPSGVTYDYEAYQPKDPQSQRMINQQVYHEIVNENLVNEIMHDELVNMPEFSIDQWNEEYLQLYNELNQYLAKKLLESCHNDEELNY